MSVVSESDVADVLADLIAGVESTAVSDNPEQVESTAAGAEASSGDEESGSDGESSPDSIGSDSGGAEGSNSSADNSKSDSEEVSESSKSPQKEAQPRRTLRISDSDGEEKDSEPPRQEEARLRRASLMSVPAEPKSKRVATPRPDPAPITGKRVAGGPSTRLKVVVMNVVDVIDYDPKTDKYWVLWEDRDLEWEAPTNLRENYGLLLDQAKLWVTENKRATKFSVWRKKQTKGYAADNEYQCAFKAVELVFASFGVDDVGLEMLKAEYIASGALQDKQYDVGVTRAQFVGLVKFIQAQSEKLNIDLPRFASNLVQQPAKKTFTKMRGIELMLEGRSGRYVLAAMSQNRERHCMAILVRNGVITVGDADGWTPLAERVWLKKADLCWCFEVVLLQPGRKRIRLRRSDN